MANNTPFSSDARTIWKASPTNSSGDCGSRANCAWAPPVIASYVSVSCHFSMTAVVSYPKRSPWWCNGNSIQTCRFGNGLIWIYILITNIWHNILTWTSNSGSKTGLICCSFWFKRPVVYVSSTTNHGIGAMWKWKRWDCEEFRPAGTLWGVFGKASYHWSILSLR